MPNHTREGKDRHDGVGHSGHGMADADLMSGGMPAGSTAPIRVWRARSTANRGPRARRLHPRLPSAG